MCARHSPAPTDLENARLVTSISLGRSRSPRLVTKKAVTKPSPISRLPVELLGIIFEYYVKVDGPVSVLIQVNRLWRRVAIASQPLWRRILLSADAIPPSLRAGSVHACGDAEVAGDVLIRSGITKLEVTLVLGPQAPESPPPEDRIKLFKTVDTNALSRITFLCIIINPQMTLSLVTASLIGVFHSSLPSLESMMIASAYAIGNLFTPLEALLDVIDKTSLNLRSVYLENVNRDFIMKASESNWWTRLARLTIRNETDPIDASLFALSTNLEFLSFSGELSYGPENHDQPIEFLLLQWLRIGVISMGTLRKLRIPKLHSMVIHTVQGNYPNPAPPHHTLEIPELKIFHVATVNSSVACIVAPKLETLCLGIPTLKNTDANNILNAIFDGHEKMIKPKHLTLTAPVHDKHLLHALTLLPDLMSLQLDHQVPFTKGFFKAMTPSKTGRGKKELCPKLRCLVLDLHKAAGGTGGVPLEGNPEHDGEVEAEGEAREVEVAAEDHGIAEFHEHEHEEEDAGQIEGENAPKGEQIWMRERLVEMMSLRKKHGTELLRLACRWTENGSNEELVHPTMCLSCIEVRAAGG